MADQKHCTCNKKMKNSGPKGQKGQNENEQDWNPLCKCLVHCPHIKRREEGNGHVHVFKLLHVIKDIIQ